MKAKCFQSERPVKGGEFYCSGVFCYGYNDYVVHAQLLTTDDLYSSVQYMCQNFKYSSSIDITRLNICVYPNNHESKDMSQSTAVLQLNTDCSQNCQIVILFVLELRV